MTTRLTLSDPELVAVTLQPRRVLHGRTDLESLDFRVYLGAPLVTRLSADVLDHAAAEFLRTEEPQAAYYLLNLIINCYPTYDAPLVAADVGVLLTHDGPADIPAPVAWSMTPNELITPVTGSTTVDLTANLGFVKAGVTHTIENAQERFLLGLGEGQSNPEWQFRATSSQHEIVGIHRLSVIVRAPSDVRCQAGIIVAATVRKRRAGLIRYRAQLPTSLASVRFPP